jgi:hypothetical protein
MIKEYIALLVNPPCDVMWKCVRTFLQDYHCSLRLQTMTSMPWSKALTKNPKTLQVQVEKNAEIEQRIKITEANKPADQVDLLLQYYQTSERLNNYLVLT